MIKKDDEQGSCISLAIVPTLQYNFHSIWCQQMKIHKIFSSVERRPHANLVCRKVRSYIGTVKPLLLHVLSTTMEIKNYYCPLFINDNEPHTIKCTLYTGNYTIYAHIRYPYTITLYTMGRLYGLPCLHQWCLSKKRPMVRGNATCSA
jgi:hypothetical protein